MEYRSMRDFSLSRLAVDERYHGMGVGEDLLSHCLEHRLTISTCCGARYVIADVKTYRDSLVRTRWISEDSGRFYRDLDENVRRSKGRSFVHRPQVRLSSSSLICSFPDDPRSTLVNVLGCLDGACEPSLGAQRRPRSWMAFHPRRTGIHTPNIVAGCHRLSNGDRLTFSRRFSCEGPLRQS